MNVKKLNEEIIKLINEESSEQFMLTNLDYTISYASGKSYKKFVPNVDTLGYKLYDLGPAQIADIVLKNLEDGGFKLTTNDSSNIHYDAQTGTIKNVNPIIVSDYNEDKASISFKMVLWVHPDRIDYR